jgi:hypothetical protein
MPTYLKERGIRKVSPIVTVAAAATEEVLYQLTTATTVPRTCYVRKIHAYNNVGATTLMLGTGPVTAWVQQLPTYRLANAMDNIWVEDEILAYEFVTDVFVQTDVLGVLVMIEVEEIESG